MHGINAGGRGSADDVGESGDHDGELLLAVESTRGQQGIAALDAAGWRLSGGVGSSGSAGELLHLATVKRRIGGA